MSCGKPVTQIFRIRGREREKKREIIKHSYLFYKMLTPMHANRGFEINRRNRDEGVDGYKRTIPNHT